MTKTTLPCSLRRVVRKQKLNEREVRNDDVLPNGTKQRSARLDVLLKPLRQVYFIYIDTAAHLLRSLLLLKYRSLSLKPFPLSVWISLSYHCRSGRVYHFDFSTFWLKFSMGLWICSVRVAFLLGFLASFRCRLLRRRPKCATIRSARNWNQSVPERAGGSETASMPNSVIDARKRTLFSVFTVCWLVQWLLLFFFFHFLEFKV